MSGSSHWDEFPVAPTPPAIPLLCFDASYTRARQPSGLVDIGCFIADIHHYTPNYLSGKKKPVGCCHKPYSRKQKVKHRHDLNLISTHSLSSISPSPCLRSSSLSVPSTLQISTLVRSTCSYFPDCGYFGLDGLACNTICLK